MEQRNTPSRLVDWNQFQDELKDIQQQLHRERKAAAKRIWQWQTVAISAACGALFITIIVLAFSLDKLSDIERVALEVAHQLRVTQAVVVDLKERGDALASDVQRLEWRVDRGGKGM